MDPIGVRIKTGGLMIRQKGANEAVANSVEIYDFYFPITLTDMNKSEISDEKIANLKSAYATKYLWLTATDESRLRILPKWIELFEIQMAAAKHDSEIAWLERVIAPGFENEVSIMVREMHRRWIMPEPNSDGF